MIARYWRPVMLTGCALMFIGGVAIIAWPAAETAAAYVILAGALLGLTAIAAQLTEHR